MTESIEPTSTSSAGGTGLDSGSDIALALGIPALIVASLSLWVAYRQLRHMSRRSEQPHQSQDGGKPTAADDQEKILGKQVQLSTRSGDLGKIEVEGENIAEVHGDASN